MIQKVVLDTNVFVAAGFNKNSASAQIIEEIREDPLRMVWNEATRVETRSVLQQIPPLSWDAVADLFCEDNRYEGATHSDHYETIPDPTDRKFAALAKASGATLVTLDADFLDHRDHVDVEIMTSEGFTRRQ